MESDKTSGQLFLAAGCILGAVVVALFGLSAGEKGLHEWQELLAGLIGAGFTLIGATVIVNQIKADDEREEKTARRKSLEVAQSAVIEIKRILEILAAKEVDTINILALTSKMVPDGAGGYTFASESDKLDWDMLEERSARNPDYSRLSVHIESAGVLGLTAGEALIHFYEQASRLKFLRPFPTTASDRISPDFWVRIAGHIGEEALRHLMKIVELKGDISKLPEAEGSDSSNIDIDAWRQRVSGAWKTWYMIKALRDAPHRTA